MCARFGLFAQLGKQIVHYLARDEDSALDTAEEEKKRSELKQWLRRLLNCRCMRV